MCLWVAAYAAANRKTKAAGRDGLAAKRLIIRADSYPRPGVEPLLSNRLLENWSDPEKRNILGKYIDFLAEEHPEKSVRIVRGFATADRSVMVISGDGAVGKMRGEAILKKEKDNWRVDDEITDLAT